MSLTEDIPPESTPADSTSEPISFILSPGSSLHPTLLLAVDGTLAFLLVIFIGLAFAAGPSARIHVLALIGIELGLWASIKWVVYELQKTNVEETKKIE